MPIVGDVLAGRYRIDGLLGAGGMASVYRATDLRLDRAVALKVLSANLAADGTVAQRFEREARALAAAAHPSVVAVFDVEAGDREIGREPFYVMELCDGGSLAERLTEAGRLEPSELMRAVAAVAEGLAELHRRGIVHRDVKPANIVYLGDSAKLADFGLARSEDQDLTTLTAAGLTVGTLAYLAPELLAGSAATPSSDVYALGVAAFQGLTGRLPRAAASIGELVETRTDPIAMVSSIAPDLGSAFDRPIGAALSVEASARPTADELAGGLTAALAGWHPVRPHEAIDTGTPRVAPAEPSFMAAADPLLETVPSLPTAPQRNDTPDAGTDATTIQRTRGTPARARRTGQRHIRRSTARQPPARRSLLDRPALIVLAAFALVVLALAGLSTILGGSAPGASPSAGVALAGSPPPSAVASPASPSPVRPSASPIATPTKNPAAPALAALADVDSAISAARGAGGLKGKQANELERLAHDVRSALEAGDFKKAREAADRLREQVEKVDEELDRTRRERLRDAVAALIDAIPED